MDVFINERFITINLKCNKYNCNAIISFSVFMNNFIYTTNAWFTSLIYTSQAEYFYILTKFRYTTFWWISVRRVEMIAFLSLVLFLQSCHIDFCNVFGGDFVRKRGKQKCKCDENIEQKRMNEWSNDGVK